MIKSIILTSLTIFTVYYIYFITRVRIGLLKSKHHLKSDAHTPFVSIIVAVRNEQNNIGKCLQSLLNQTYQLNKYEIIIVDDGSVDNTAEIVKKFMHNYKNINFISDKEWTGKNSSKIRALTKGIEQSKGDIILTTDADCIVPNRWIELLVSYFENDVALVAGPVLEDASISILSKFENIEILGLTTVSAGLIGSGRPIICNGANLAYRKSAFYRVGGFDKKSKNDDESLMNKISLAKIGKIIYALNAEAVVKTNSSNNLVSFFKQRMRWANKRKHYNDITILFSLASLYLFFLSLLISIILIFYEQEFITPVIIVIFGKIILDYFTLRIGAKVFKHRFSFIYFLIAEIFHIPYVVITALFAQIATLNWKERKIT